MPLTKQTFRVIHGQPEIGSPCTILDIKKFIMAATHQLAGSFTSSQRAALLERDEETIASLVLLQAIPTVEGWTPNPIDLFNLFNLLDKMASKSHTKMETIASIIVPLLTQGADDLLGEIIFSEDDAKFKWSGNGSADNRLTNLLN